MLLSCQTPFLCWIEDAAGSCERFLKPFIHLEVEWISHDLFTSLATADTNLFSTMSCIQNQGKDFLNIFILACRNLSRIDAMKQMVVIRLLLGCLVLVLERRMLINVGAYLHFIHNIVPLKILQILTTPSLQDEFNLIRTHGPDFSMKSTNLKKNDITCQMWGKHSYRCLSH